MHECMSFKRNAALNGMRAESAGMFRTGEVEERLVEE